MSGLVPEKNAKWFKTIGDYVICPDDLARKYRWKSHECISPGVRSIEDLEIWPRDAIDFYNHQPVWDLTQLKTDSRAQARAALAEFVEELEYAANHFCWIVADPDESVHWKQHGWKHVWWEEFVDIWELHEADDPVNRAQAFGREEIRRLFIDASNEDPEAVGRVWSLFKDGSEHAAIMDEFFSKEERPKDIPAPGKIAEKLVNSMFSRSVFVPKLGVVSPNLAIPARGIKRMISAIQSHGMPIRKGRPRITVSPAILRLLLKMGRCQAIQVNQVVDFLEKNQISRNEQLTLLRTVYPWIERKIYMDPFEFNRLSPSRAAGQIVSKVSQVSCSALEKLGLNPLRGKIHTK